MILRIISILMQASLLRVTQKIFKTNKASIFSVLNNEFSSNKLGKAILTAFKKGKGDYSLTGFSMVKLPDKIRKDAVKLNFNEKGVLTIK